MFRRFTATSAASTAASTVASPAGHVERYSRPIRVLHFAQALAVVGAIGSGTFATQQPKTKEGQQKRGDAMFWHKSMGSFVFATLPIRAYYRLQPGASPGIPGSAVKRVAAQLMHGSLYGGAAFMATTGLIMTFYSGKGLPMFVTTLTQFKTSNPDQSENGRLSKLFYQIHTSFGYYWKVLVPLHVAGGVFSYTQGLRTFARMNPFVF
ncbi:hypothetical protein BASA81_007387 [Batrachochytrium salamandrivorans]|nr:hypothetical protein BASA81_018098 [Batrachochytrium salamandrivorans]KAH9254630.1 hypothetical protein BASA81_007387 [Batrachochytrium salamandrivorans]